MQWQPMQIPAGMTQQQVFLPQQQMAAMTSYQQQQQQQMYWQQYYPQWTAVQTMPMAQVPVQAQQPQMTQPPLPVATRPPLPPEPGVNPAPPMEPPSEEKPPLPPEPPPPEPTPPVPPSGKETEKLSTLQAQATQWQQQQQQQQQWQKYQQDLYQYQQQMQQWQQQQAPENIQKKLDTVIKEEAEFEKSYNDWLKQYIGWKEANKNHPNQEQYKQYEDQWKTYEAQMNQKRKDIEQRKASLTSQMASAQPVNQGNAPQGPQASEQWNNQLNQGNNQWTSQRPDHNKWGGPRGTQGGPQFPGPRGPGNQGSRFANPQQSGMVSQSSRAPGNRNDESRFNQNDYGYYDESRNDGFKGSNPFGNDNYENTEQYDDNIDNRFSGPRGRGSGGPRNSRFGPRLGQGGPGFESRGGAGRQGLRPSGGGPGSGGHGSGGPGSGGPVPLMDLNVSKPKSSFDHQPGGDSHKNHHQPGGNGQNNRQQYDSTKSEVFVPRNEEEALMSQMGLPVTFGGSMDDDDEEKPPQPSKSRNNQPSGPPKSRWGPPRDQPPNRQNDQRDKHHGQFDSGPGFNVGRGPRPMDRHGLPPPGPPPTRLLPPRPQPPSLLGEQSAPENPPQNTEKPPWEHEGDWDEWNGQKDKRSQREPSDPKKIELSDAQLSMIKGVTQELSLLREQQEKLHQLQKLQDAFEADKKTGGPGDKAKEDKEGTFGKVHDYGHGNVSRPRPGDPPPRRDPWAERRPPFEDPYHREYGRYPPPPPHDPYYDPYRRGYEYYDRLPYAPRDPFARGRSPPLIPGAEGPVKVVDYGHGEDRSKSPGAIEDPWAKDRRNPEDPWARDSRSSDTSWDRSRDRSPMPYNRDRVRDESRDRGSPLSRDNWNRGPTETRESRHPWDRDRDERSRGREWRDRSPVRERDGFDRDRRRDRFRNSPQGDRDMLSREKSMKGGENENGRDRNMGSRQSGGFGYYGGMSDANTKIESVSVEDLLCEPGRKTRPEHLVVIIRGLPGSGKSHVAKLLKEKEVANGGGAPRLLSIDDYFMAEHDTVTKDPDTGRKISRTEMKYEYEAEMEEIYRRNLVKSFKKQIDNLLFNFIIVDACNEKVEYFEEFWSYAKSKGFQVYVVEIQAEANTCFKRNIHDRTLSEILRINEDWEETPRHYLRLDIRTLLQDLAITEVEMEEAMDEPAVEEDKKSSEDDDEDTDDGGLKKSRWELDVSEARLDQLDGIRKRSNSEHSPQHMSEYLQLPDDYETRTYVPGKKRVRWADIEEKKNQDRAREIGFVVGQTDWNKIMDDNYAQNALNRTKYI